MLPETDLYPPEYFADRNMTDRRRLESFEQEYQWMEASGVDCAHGTMCDVGCSTGEFLETVNWTGERYGMEVSAEARFFARRRGIRFRQNITNQRNFFDVVLFRGTIQHVDEPFRYIRCAFDALKPGGHIVFLQTPNADSLVYRLFGDLPALEPSRNWWIPSERTLKNALANAGFQHVATRKSYWLSPYANPLTDWLKFGAQFFRKSRPQFSWPGNMMDTAWRKPA